MKHEDIYPSWVRARKQVSIDPAFADRVMDQVKRRQASGDSRIVHWSRLAERIGVSPWTKAAALGIASLLGLGRILLTLHLLLFA